MSKKPGLMLRIVAGIYLAYLGVRLIQQVRAEQPSNSLLMMCFGVAFIVVGAVFVVVSGRSVLKQAKEDRENAAMDQEEDDPEDYEEESDEDYDEEQADADAPEASLETSKDVSQKANGVKMVDLLSEEPKSSPAEEPQATSEDLKELKIPTGETKEK